MKPAERRLVNRATIEIPACEELVSGTTQRASIMNISEMGLRYLKPHNKSASQTNEALLEFILPTDTHTISACGHIVEEISHEYFLETAIFFSFIRERDKQKIQRFVGDQLLNKYQNPHYIRMTTVY